MRQIVLDTETTGISPESGHRIIEIGCVELHDRKLTGRTFHTYLNPERDVEEGAFRVHGISTEFLQDKPLFSSIAEDLITFIEGTELIIHNAPFDTGFLNTELRRINWHQPLLGHCTVFDTLAFAREKHPGQRNSLDALCKRYNIDNSNRQLHGALLDAQILALVYLAMTGGQGTLFQEEGESERLHEQAIAAQPPIIINNSPVIALTELEQQKHEDYIRFLVKKSGVNLWEEEEISS